MLFILLNSCGTSRPVEVVDIEFRDLDTLMVQADKPNALKTPEDFTLDPYQASNARENDLLHTALDLRFDWSKEKVIGKADLTIKPYFQPVTSLQLDAKDFEIQAVEMAGEKLEYKYDGSILKIDLGRPFTRKQKYTINISYTARPAASGGSAAITSNQGLFFINANGEEDKPQQIWTQGETEWNSRWFPTIDKPNERFTQEFKLTVAQRFSTLSNGILTSSLEHTDGTRTDTWVMDQAHAPYLAMIAVGEFAIVRDQWQDIPISYYVEPEYEASATAIFNHTPEMLEFFSDRLGVKYPWSKYAQIIVRDYVSGAMENTTAVVFGDFVQKHKNELIDNDNDKIVAHELIHHWFGDFVTCESWANLTMNEGFANYGEYLWLEHKYGKETADFHLLTERNTYLLSAGLDVHPLIHFEHEDKEDMFDAHSYNKGGAVLHMLRNYVGDEAFWEALQLYLEENAFSAVEAHDLRLAFEEVTGEDLNWFFDQWFFAQGHPELTIQYDYDPQSKEAIVRVEQLQDPERMPAIFQLPVAIDLFVEGKRQRAQVWLKQRVQSFRFPVAQKPDLSIFDAEYSILGFLDFERSAEEYIFQYKNGTHFLDRMESLEALQQLESPMVASILPLAFEDDFWYIRKWAIEQLSEEVDEASLGTLQTLVLNDPHSKVRAAALEVLGNSNDPSLISLAKTIIEEDSASVVIGGAIQLLYKLDREKATEYIQVLEDTDSESIISAIGRIYGESEEVRFLPFFAKNLKKVNTYAVAPFYRYYQELAAFASEEEGLKAMRGLKLIAQDQAESPWRRLAATSSITDMANEWQARANRSNNTSEKIDLNKKVDILAKDLETIKNTEKNDQLKSFYRQMVVIERR